MKISTKGRYGLTIMIALAKGHPSKNPISLKVIAQEYHLSEHYLEQLIAPLRNVGLVRSVRELKVVIYWLRAEKYNGSRHHKTT